MKKMLTVFGLASLLVLTGCNTVKGFGKDVSRAGNAVTDGAEKTQDRIHNN